MCVVKKISMAAPTELRGGSEVTKMAAVDRRLCPKDNSPTRHHLSENWSLGH